MDKAVLERSDRVACVTATFTWDDVGSWEALARTHAPDEDGNVVVGEGERGGGQRATSSSPRVGAWCSSASTTCVVVRTGAVTLVMPRTHAPDLKDLLGALEQEG